MRALLTAAAMAIASTAAFGQEGKLVLYTSQPQTDAQQTIDAFKAKFPKVDVSFVRDGTPRVMAKLRAEIEAGQPQADILLIADSVTMEGLKKEGRLLPHKPANLAAYPAGIHDKDGFWFGTKLITTGIVYNAKAPFKPTSWADLKRPEAKGQLALPSPLTSGAAMIHTVTLVANLPEGWGFYDAIAANKAVPGGGNGDILKQVAGGEKMFGMIVDYMPIREKAKGAPVEFVFPKEGVSAVSEPVAILKTTKNEAAARAFIDFVLSPEGQDLATKQGYVPALPTAALPPGYPEREAIRLMTFDAGKALAEDDANKKRFSDIFGQ
ncbi:ABC transporter substrate-binding protein [uncultured Alsobacter sp.]|uniref:ABC transporter substrate-binding protein n=1 Tax=uncultured Alsobacter sp. TaxID=1748258 RepID=UPI0025D251F0|nr:ABC transporter substrate-binding protein [uncultured Alsobacter sp.]